MMRTLGLFLVLLAGCDGAGHPDWVAGFTPPTPTSDELQIISPAIRNIPAGANLMYCSYLDVKIAQDIDVISSRGVQTTGGHHALLYVARRMKPVDTHLCTEDDMTNIQYLAGTGADNALSATAFRQLPDGLAFRVPAGAQLMIQTHWLNASQKMIDGQAAINLKTVPPTPDRVLADLFSIVDTGFTIPAGGRGQTTSTCPITDDLSLFFLAGHEHKLGSHVSIAQSDSASAAPTMLYDYDWQPEYEFNAPDNSYTKASPLVFKAGQQVSVHCEWDNTAGASDVKFPDEMCAAFGLYFPGRGEIDCVDGQWPAN